MEIRGIGGNCKDETGFTSANSELYPISSVRTHG